MSKHEKRPVKPATSKEGVPSATAKENLIKAAYAKQAEQVGIKTGEVDLIRLSEITTIVDGKSVSHYGDSRPGSQRYTIPSHLEPNAVPGRLKLVGHFSGQLGQLEGEVTVVALVDHEGQMRVAKAIGKDHYEYLRDALSLMGYKWKTPRHYSEMEGSGDNYFPPPMSEWLASFVEEDVQGLLNKRAAAYRSEKKSPKATPK